MSLSKKPTGKVVLIDYTAELFSPVGFEAELLAEVGATWEVYQVKSKEEVVQVAADADVVAVQATYPWLTREVLEQLTRCRCTIRAGAGYDSIDYKAATELGIMVCNAPTYCTDDVAEHAIALMLGCIRNLTRQDAAIRRNEYRKAKALALPTHRVAQRTLGIIGLGRIGSRVARRMMGFDMTVLAYDPYVSQNYADLLGIKMVSLEELLERSDFITVHCLLTEETHHLLSWDEFARIKPGAILVNTARGPIVHQEPLVEALKDGRVWAAGLDVTEIEPLPPDSPLLELDNVILTPHSSASTPEAREDLYRLICEISADVVRGRIPRFVVNPEVLSHLKKVE
mgnify:FL=1